MSNWTKTIVILGSACSFIGCTKTIEVNRYPDFYTPDIESVAILPFDNDTLTVNAGRYVSEQLAIALGDNGTYGVIDSDQMASGPGGEDVKNLRPHDTQAAAELVARFTKARAFITGRVTTFTSAEYNYIWRHRGYGYGWYGRGPFRHYPINMSTHNEGRARISAKLVVISGTQILSQTPMQVSKTVFSDGYRPYLTPDECLIEAAKRAVGKLVDRFAVVRVRVKIPLDKVLKATVADGHIEAIVKLPGQCRGNPFRLEAVAEGLADPVIIREFIWSGKQSEYKLSEPLDQPAGEEKGRRLTITLYSDSEPIKSVKATVK